MAQKSEPVFIVQRRRVRLPGSKLLVGTAWYNVRVADDRFDAREYAARMNRRARNYEYRVDPHRSTKL